MKKAASGVLPCQKNDALCPSSAVPRATASRTSKPPTSSPAAYNFICMRWSDSAVMRWASRAATAPVPGALAGQEVTIFHLYMLLELVAVAGR